MNCYPHSMPKLNDTGLLKESSIKNKGEKMEEKQKPKVYKNGLVEITLWERNINGNIFQTFNINKIYMDKTTKKWSKNNSFVMNDIDTIFTLLYEVKKDSVVNKIEKA